MGCPRSQSCRTDHSVLEDDVSDGSENKVGPISWAPGAHGEDHDKKEGGCKKRHPAWVHWKKTQQIRERPGLSQTTKQIIVEHLNSNLRMKHSDRCLSRGEMFLQVKEL